MLAAWTLEMGMIENDNEDDILARAIGDIGAAVTGRCGVRRGGRWAARRLKTVAYEKVRILDMPLSAETEPVHAALATIKHSCCRVSPRPPAPPSSRRPAALAGAEGANPFGKAGPRSTAVEGRFP